MRAGQRHPEPDEGEERVWQPIHPGDTPFLEAAAEVQIEPNVEELIRANPRNPIGLESASSKTTFRDAVVAFEWGDAPPKRTLGKNDARFSMVIRMRGFAKKSPQAEALNLS